MTTADDLYTDDYSDDEQQQAPEPPRENRNLALLREKAEKHLPAALTRAEKAERELAFLKAGIDTDSKTGKLFAKAYDGDATPDAVRAAALEYGLIEEPDESATEEAQALTRVTSAHTGGAPANSGKWTADEFAGQHQRWSRFRKDHPHLADRLLSGDQIDPVPGY